MKILAIRPLADSAVTLDLAASVGAEAADRVTTALVAIEQAIDRDDLPGACEVAAAFCSLTIHYDCLTTSQADLVGRLERLLAPLEPDARPNGRFWRLPCCYDASVGIDLADLARHLGMSEQDIVDRHAAVRFQVYALGFLPGLPFMGDLPADLARPRRTEPRTQVPAGSVAIANRMCVIYPWVSPGGWHIVGCCPVPLFDIARPSPALLGAGDTVQFDPVTRSRFDALRRQAEAGTLDVSAFCVGQADG